MQEAVLEEQALQRLLQAGAAAGMLQLVQQGGKQRVQLRHSALKAYGQGGEEEWRALVAALQGLLL